jgi:hypothetical protein
MAAGITPDVSNRKLKDASCFYGSCVSIPHIPYEQVFGNLKYISASDWWDDPVPNDVLDVLRKHIQGGNPAIVCVDSMPAMKGVQYHYMLAVGVGPTGEIIVNDPWYNVTDEIGNINKIWWQKLLRGTYGEDSAHCIYRFDLLKAV